MKTAYSVAPERWRGFFKTLSALYAGWELRIEVLGASLGDQEMGKGLQLQGFSFDSRKPGADLLIEAFGRPDVLFIHCVNHPMSVWAAETELGREADIRVESEDRTCTLVRLRRFPELPRANGD